MNPKYNQINELSFEEKRFLLKLLISKRDNYDFQQGVSDISLSKDGWSPIIPDTDHRYQPFPLTDMQQAYLFGRSDAFELGNVACHFYQEFESENLNLKKLNHAWQSLVKRHDMLRAIVLPNGQQQILEEVPLYEIEIADMRTKSHSEVATYLQDIRRRMSNQVLQPEKWPLFEIRATLLDRGLVILHLDVDALFIDAWSMLCLFNEWRKLYEQPDSLQGLLELSFRDTVIAEQEFRKSDQYKRAREYWIKRSKTLPAPPDLPLERGLSGQEQPEFVRRTGCLDEQAWKRIKSRASEEGITPSVVLCSAFSEVLSTWSKSRRFSLNLTMFNRPPLHPQMNQIMGEFTSTIILEVDNSPDAFKDRARHLQKQLESDLDHYCFSGVRVQRELKQIQSWETIPAMPVVFTSILGHSTSQNDGLLPLDWLGKLAFGVSQTPQVWLDHQVFEDVGQLKFNWDVVESLFPEGLVQDMFNAYCDLLRQLSDGDEAWSVRTHTLVPITQLKQREVINATDIPSSDRMLQTLFVDQVALHSDQKAVISSRKSLTYGELYKRSTQVGYELRRLGVTPNRLVGIVMEKGWEQVVAVLGVLQSGAAYLPIDSDLPRERLCYLLEHGEVELVLTQPWLEGKIDWPEGIRCLTINNEFPTTDNGPLEPIQGPDDLAYVIYTSGSTGLPKGVMIDHKGAVNTILDVNNRYNVGANDRIFALSSLSFDLSVYDIFGALAAGGAIVIPDRSSLRDPAHWAELMIKEKISIWNSVPTLMAMLVEYLEGRSKDFPASFQLVLLSGDWIPVDLPNRIRAMSKNIEIISLGGATEASIWSIIYPIKAVQQLT